MSDSGRPRSDVPALTRILETPHLALAVPRLPPEVLHKLIEHCGLEACGEIVALATPGQLSAVFDLDLWRSAKPGVEERFDPERFVVWLEVLAEAGAGFAAGQVAEVDAALVVAALAAHLRVFDPGAVALEAGIGRDIGGYTVVPRHADLADVIVAVLAALAAGHREYFARVMRGCRALSDSAPEVDGLDNLLPRPGQVLFDLAVDRERRREKQGYIAPEQARVFLETSRQRVEPGGPPRVSPIAAAYFRGLDWTTDALPDSTAAPDESAASAAAVIDALVDAGVLPEPPRGLLEAAPGHVPRLARIRAQMLVASDRAPSAYLTRTQELAYLANVLAAGCSIQARPLGAQEASDGAVAVCNLGLENWPAALPDGFLVNHDLLEVFQAGWATLYEKVCMFAGEQLVAVLATLQCGDRDIQAELNQLRKAMAKQCRAGTPWRARHALDVMVTLDPPAWAGLLGLIAEFPVLHAGIGASGPLRPRSVSASSFEFISENSQIETVRAFMASLPETLRR